MVARTQDASARGSGFILGILRETTPAMDAFTRQHWLTALQTHQPTLPGPVAERMVDNAANGQLGATLQVFQTALTELQGAKLDDITGSEARVLVAILSQMRSELTQLQASIAQLWA